MKAGTFIASLFLLFIAAYAQPHCRFRPTFRGSLYRLTSLFAVHKHRHPKREQVTTYVIIEIPEVVAWLDRAGHTVSLETKGQVVTRTRSESPTGVTPDAAFPTAVKAANTPADNGVHASSQTSIPTTTNSEEPTTISHPGPEVTTTLMLSPAPSPSKSATLDAFRNPTVSSTVETPGKKTQDSKSDDGIGICYSAYGDNGSCKTLSQVEDEFSQLTNYTLLRSYGVDCNQVKHMVTAAKAHDKKLFLGVFDLQNLQHELQTLIESVDGSWDLITAVSIGNELVNTGKASPQDVVNAVNSARPTLRDAGFQGPVVTVDTFNAIIAHPELCHASDDFCAANCHAFFDANIQASEAGDYVKTQAERVSAAAGDKRTVITESGWPHEGSANGQATPSEQNQQMAVDSLKAAFADTDGALYLFSAFDTSWKTDSPRTFGTEKYWGVM